MTKACIKKLALIAIALTAYTVPNFITPSIAGWVDDWLDQKTATAPGYYEGQKRGYYSAGGFSGRVKMNTDPPITVMPPKIKVGCGGIDAFWGGFGFLNFDYLVQKGQRILQAAPYASFDIALNTLCTPCAQTIKSVEAIANQLNSLQLDDCRATRAIATYAVSPFAPQKNQEELGRIRGQFYHSTGLDNLWSNIQKNVNDAGGAWNSTPENFATSNTSPAKSCSDSVKAILAQEGSLLQRIGSRIGLTDDYIAIARGMLGDVYTYTYNGITVVPYPPCPQNNGAKATDITSTGDLYVRRNGSPSLGACEAYSGASLKQQSQTRIERIISSMRNQTPLEAGDEEYLNQTPMALGLILKTGIMMGIQDELILTLPDLVAKGYAYLMLNDMVAHVDYAIAKAQQEIAAQKTGTATPRECVIEIFEDGMQSLAELRNRGAVFAKQLQGEYQSILNERTALQQWVDRYESFNKLAHSEIQQRFGLSVANRAMGIW